MSQAHIIIANHDLVLSDLALGGGYVLPHPSVSMYVFDEGHHLAEKAVEHNAAAANVGTIENQGAELRALPIEGWARGGAENNRNALADAIETRAKEWRERISTLPLSTTDQGEAVYRGEAGDMPEPVREAARGLQQALQDASKVIDAALDELMDAGPEEGELRDRVGSLAARLTEQARLCQLVAKQTAPDEPPIARWVESRRRDYHVAAAQVTAAPMLRDMLWKVCAGAVITSATLASSDGFNRFRAKTGLGHFPETRYEQLRSPFDYANAAVLRVPRMQTQGNQGQEHTDEIGQKLPAILRADPVATLVLFTSWKQMRSVRDAMPDDIRSRLRCQGEATRDALLAAHRDDVAKGQASILFGLNSFAEGVDLRGEQCEHVIVCKLPFAPPDSPVEATRAEWLESLGRSPFMTMVVPEATLKLCQAAGRLMRAESDRGRITLLDRRVVTKAYGKQMLAALPPFRREIE